ncbi:MAG: hypothetical protein RLZZ337_556, partial [Bacteroidota bacterium]
MKYIIQSAEKYTQAYNAGLENPEKFWGEFAEQEFTWHKKWDKVLQYDLHI